MTIAFYALAVVAVIGALLAVQLTNLVRAVFGLLLFFGALAVLFLLLMAEFLVPYVLFKFLLLCVPFKLCSRTTANGANGLRHRPCSRSRRLRRLIV